MSLALYLSRVRSSEVLDRIFIVSCDEADVHRTARTDWRDIREARLAPKCITRDRPIFAKGKLIAAICACQHNKMGLQLCVIHNDSKWPIPPGRCSFGGNMRARQNPRLRAARMVLTYDVAYHSSYLVCLRSNG